MSFNDVLGLHLSDNERGICWSCDMRNDPPSDYLCVICGSYWPRVEELEDEFKRKS